MQNYIIAVLLLFIPFSDIFSQNPDIDLLKQINVERNKNLDDLFLGITNTSTPIAIGYPVIMFGIGYFQKDSVIKYDAIYIGASVFSAVVITEIMKYSINRPRPFETYPFIEKLSVGGSPSFPSGHTSTAFSLATSLSLKYPKWYVIAPSLLWASSVGYSRMDLGVHYPSDVLVGAIVGAGSAYLCYQIQDWLNNLAKIP